MVTAVSVIFLYYYTYKHTKKLVFMSCFISLECTDN